MAARVIAVLGAECTGKTTLVQQLRQALAAPKRRVASVAEHLRAWCDAERRTPRADEQFAIAAEQTRLIAKAAELHDIVVADTTALQTAVYSDYIFGDRSLYAAAQRWHAATHLTLLTALDLPWQADGLQRDGEHVRAPVDMLLRHALGEAQCPYAVVHGQGDARLANALAAIEAALRPPTVTAGPGWSHACDLCGDAACERHLFTGLAGRAAAAPA